MIHIDKTKCTGCGDCIERCSQKAITVDHDRAVINQELCTGCGTCVSICPIGAIHELAPVSTRLREGGDRMYYGYGRGLGFRGASPPWPYVGRGRGGLPRCWYPGVATAFPYVPGPRPYAPGVKQEQEVGFLKEEAEAMRRHMEDVEARIKELEIRQD